MSINLHLEATWVQREMSKRKRKRVQKNYREWVPLLQTPTDVTRAVLAAGNFNSRLAAYFGWVRETYDAELAREHVERVTLAVNQHQQQDHNLAFYGW